MKDGRVLFFEAIRGKPNPKGDPTAPPYSVDVRIRDANKIAFLLSVGGNRPANPQWIEDQKATEGIFVDDNDRMLDFMLVPDLAKALRNYQWTHKNVLPELRQLIELAGSVNVDDLFDSDSNPMQGGVQPNSVFATKYKHKVYIRKKPLDNYPILEHSALRFRIYTMGGTLKYEYNTCTCNHGTCANDSHMSTKCDNSWTRDNLKMYIWDKMCDAYNSKCNLPILTYHSCNDDTQLQYYATKNQGFSSGAAGNICGYPAPWAPSCN